MRVGQVQNCVSVAMDRSIYHTVKHVYLCVTMSQRLTVNDSPTLCVCRFTVDFGTLQPNTFFPKLLNILPASPHPPPIYTHRKINASHMRRTFFRVQQHQG